MLQLARDIADEGPRGKPPCFVTFRNIFVRLCPRSTCGCLTGSFLVIIGSWLRPAGHVRLLPQAVVRQPQLGGGLIPEATAHFPWSEPCASSC